METSQLNILQNKFHVLLESFLNGNLFSKQAKILYPLIKSISIQNNLENIKYINQILHFNMIPETNYEMAIYISKVYKDLLIKNNLNIISDKNVQCKFNYNKTNYNNGKKKIVCNLIDFLKYNKLYNYIDLFLIHGSYSTLDFEENISDLDTLILINDNTMLNPKKLVELQAIIFSSFKYFYDIDLLQHHGYFILTKFDTKYYNETFFPLMLFNYSTEVYSTFNSTLQIKLRDNTIERRNLLNQTLNYLKSNDIDQLYNLMDYKLYFQIVQLLPISYLQYKGIQIYKKDSFQEFLKYFNDYKSLFDEIYLIRLKWKQNNIDSYNTIKFLNNRQIHYLNTRLEKTKESYKFNKKLLFKLISEIENRIKNESI